MSHAYRLHTGGNQTLDGWDVSKQYGQNEINNIVDPSGATASLPITSVPTPFASLELTRNAFGICGAVDANGTNHIKGDSIYHKIVSFALDTLEIFFSIKKYDNVFEIIPWNVAAQIHNLQQSESVAHQRLGQTLSLYLTQDAQAFNFSSDMVFYLLNYISGPAPLNIVGGTSPTSLAVASTNDLSYVVVPLSGNHKAYDANPVSFRTLNERDHEFIKYVWTLHLQNGFSNVYPELYKYVETCFTALSDVQLKGVLRTVAADDIQCYEPVMVGAANIVLPGNVVLGTFQAPDPGAVSDFTIKADYASDSLPLVLPNSSGYNVAGMRYVTGPWDTQTKAPYCDSRPMAERTLPNDGTQYPYLTADDIFQPYIIRTAFPIDEGAYFLGNYKGKGDFSYLIPLKKEIFKYLSLETICGNTAGPHATHVLELRDLAGGSVEAIINIPVQKGKYITFRRCYMAIDDTPRVEDNLGVVVDCTFDLYLYPSYHIANAADVAKPQRVYLLDGDWREQTKDYDYTVELFKEGKNFETNFVTSVINRADKSVASTTSKIFTANDEFDIVQVSNGFAKGLLFPKYKNVGSGTDAYDFAIDFGTTNTHIEYRVNNGHVTKPLEMSQSDSAVLALHPNDRYYQNLFDGKSLNTFIGYPYQEFLPTVFGTNEMAGFPLRTNICMEKSGTSSVT